MTRPLDLICLGRAAVDLYGQQIGGRLEDMQTFAKYLGGSSANVAAGTARLGVRSSMLTRVGDEHMGRFVREALQREGVDTSRVATDPDRLTALVVLGSFIQGIDVVDRGYAGSALSWLTPFSLFCGVALLAGYAMLGAGWLIGKTVGPLQDWAYGRMRQAALCTLAAVAIVSLWTPLLHTEIAARWFAWPNILYLSPVPFLVALVVLKMLSGIVANAIDGSALGPLDKGLGLAFGAARGAFIVCAGYLAAAYLVKPDLHPTWVRDAYFIGPVRQGADRIEALLPEAYRPRRSETPPPTTDGQGYSGAERQPIEKLASPQP